MDMQTLLHRAALPLTLASLCLASLCLAAAIVLAAGRMASEPGDLLAAVENADDITGRISETAGRGLPLTDEQRGHIFDGIMKIHDAPVADVPAPEAASAVPGSVALQELPASVTQDIPVVEGYKFVKLDDRILLVSPVDRLVVAEMPRYRTILD
jgi:Protein of unknown function (DUF1236)